VTDWRREGLENLEGLRDAIAIHRANGTTLTVEGIIALEMKLNYLIKCFRD
jgi:hypothetical protein